MNILLAVRDQLVGLFSHVRARQGEDGQCIAIEVTIKLPNEKDRRCLVVRITQDDNILEMTLHNLTGHLPNLAPKTFDIIDPNFMDRLVDTIRSYLAVV